VRGVLRHHRHLRERRLSMRLRACVRSGATLLQRRLCLRLDELRDGLLQRQHLRDDSGRRLVQLQRRRVHQLWPFVRQLRRWCVPLRLGASVRRGSTLREWSLRL